MAEVKIQDEPALLTKRKPDLNCEESEAHPNKTQKKLEVLDNNSSAVQDKADQCEAVTEENHIPQVPNSNSSPTQENFGKIEVGLVAEAADSGGGIGDHENEDNDEDEDYGGEDSDGKAEVDRKGKGIMMDDKGKGKLMEGDDEDDDDDSDDGGVSDGDSDLSDDPLAEVDLDNILPSRTRGRTLHPGVYIANDLGNVEDDDDSEDSDA